MKPTTQKLLFCLYDGGDRSIQFSYQLTKLILPELTPGGRRSLLHMLDKQEYLYKEVVADRVSLTIGVEGREALEQLFPALKPVDATESGQWQLIVFLSPPAQDKSFRYLRNLILKYRGLVVARGVYGFLTVVPDEIQSTLDNLYKENVLIITTTPNLGFGSLRPIIVDFYHLPDLVSAYSGISTEIKQLLVQFDSAESLTDRNKKSLLQILERISETASQDPGFAGVYYPGRPNLSEVLREFQELLQLGLAKI